MIHISTPKNYNVYSTGLTTGSSPTPIKTYDPPTMSLDNSPYLVSPNVSRRSVPKTATIDFRMWPGEEHGVSVNVMMKLPSARFRDYTIIFPDNHAERYPERPEERVALREEAVDLVKNFFAEKLADMYPDAEVVVMYVLGPYHSKRTAVLYACSVKEYFHAEQIDSASYVRPIVKNNILLRYCTANDIGDESHPYFYSSEKMHMVCDCQ